MLTDRKERILAFVVRDHIATAAPVGSLVLAGRPGLEVSSATIRKELARLEGEGYLSQPHTSAGRVPTEKGYRYFVRNLMEERDLTPAERRTIRHQFHQSPLDLTEWLRLAAAILAENVRSAALVTAPTSRETRFKHLELARLQEGGVLLVLVSRDGAIRQEILTELPPASQRGLDRLAADLNARFEGMTASQIEALLESLEPRQADVGSRVARLMEGPQQIPEGELFHDGLEHMLDAPEFAEAERIQEMLALLEGPGALTTVLAQAPLGPAGVQILIAGEGRWQAVRHFGIVVSRYGSADRATGLVGVLGPLRMPYERSVSAVRYVSDVMSDLFSVWYG
ncbi:MAG: heat-inducible transcriptional repressor HrcA [Anaerolineae bacterium]